MKIPNRVAIAFGSEKTAAIHAAMNGGIVNIMITDEETARELGAGEEDFERKDGSPLYK